MDDEEGELEKDDDEDRDEDKGEDKDDDEGEEVETVFCHVGQADLQLLTSGEPPTSASQSAGITGMSHCAWTTIHIFCCCSLVCP
ncbi:hypothetical protein AAY473_003177 [Plecturocebus cupreus]